ncbi:MAG: hypothetical protein [Microvirus sp.]|nr:MAG: hypothetical protein [Microvirus sp.]
MNDSDRCFFDMAIVSILSFRYHPGNKAQRQADIQEIDDVINTAYLALLRRNNFLVENNLWHG